MLLKKKSFIILLTIVFVILPILLLLLNIYTVTADPQSIFTIVKYLKHEFLPFYDIMDDEVNIKYSLSTLFYNTKIGNHFIFLFIPLLTTVGILRFQKTGSLRILQGLLIIIFFERIHALISLVVAFIRMSEYTPSFIYITVTVVSLLASIFSLNYIRTKLSVTIASDAEELVEQNVSERFLNMIIDQIVITFLAFVSTYWIVLAKFEYSNVSDWKFIIYFQICYSLQFFLYYFIIEGCFKTTVGKVITKSTIVNSEGEFISMGNAFIRTLCRYIPFEPFSFLIGSRGWHDSVSNTSVVKSFYKNDAD
ncbi:RDD family protein [Emticicia sp. 21SJ11W-3]|uniref:RDD family protein n=1 Tax=Emticicia sp. 21SJ11W-3 TaxID=2916755 RepID=UPI00209FABF2|nr:RDD family protein [Emticicia sp. 21SJ11W-3]UTA67728.1 RDD family protein [Emticicia sp. 21SJ11W-3]